MRIAENSNTNFLSIDELLKTFGGRVYPNVTYRSAYMEQEYNLVLMITDDTIIVLLDKNKYSHYDFKHRLGAIAHDTAHLYKVLNQISRDYDDFNTYVNCFNDKLDLESELRYWEVDMAISYPHTHKPVLIDYNQLVVDIHEALLKKPSELPGQLETEDGEDEENTENVNSLLSESELNFHNQ